MSSSCTETFGNHVESFIGRYFFALGTKVGSAPRKTIVLAFLLTIACGGGFAKWKTENRQEKLWVPQETLAEIETEIHEEYFGSENRFNSIIVQAQNNENEDTNVLTKERLLDAMKMHLVIENTQTSEDTGSDEDEGENSETYNFLDICTPGGGTCYSSFDGVCRCLVFSILKQWNYDLETLENDADIMSTLNQYGSREDLEAILGNAQFSDDGELLSAEAFSISYFIKDRSKEAGSDEKGSEADPISEGWEKGAFLYAAEMAGTDFPSISTDYFAARSFSDEFGGAITGDLLFVQVSYLVVFLFLGATLGNWKCGSESRWTMSLGALFMVGLSTGASFGISAACGLFYGPVHSLLPFILLGIGVDNAFIIVNAFNRERKGTRKSESNDDLTERCAKALRRAGASITVTSATDLVAFGISASSSLPALASFCAYAAIGLFFLWLFASTFFTACLVLDERRQRDNRRECLCCVTRKGKQEEIEEIENGFKESFASAYFRKYHGPAILSKGGKLSVILLFSVLFGLGVYGTLNLNVEDTLRSFVPKDSYLTDYINAADEYYPSTGIDLMIGFVNGSDIYAKRDTLANLETRLTGLSTAAPYIAEPVAESAYRNVMAGFSSYLNEYGSDGINGIALGDDNWPTSEEDFVKALSFYASWIGPGAVYTQDVSFSEDYSQIEAIRIKSEYVSLTKKVDGDVIDDASKQIEAMDATRELIASWDDDVPSSFTYSEKFLAIEGFKRIK